MENLLFISNVMVALMSGMCVGVYLHKTFGGHAKYRIILDEEDFKYLISGKEIIYEKKVKLILSDIGYARMMEIIQDKYLEMKREEEANG